MVKKNHREKKQRRPKIITKDNEIVITMSKNKYKRLVAKWLRAIR